MRIHLLINLILLIVTTFTGAVDDEFEDDISEVENNVVEIETYEPVEPREKLLYQRPVPCGPTYFFEPFHTRAEFLKRWVRSQAKKDGAEDHMVKYDGQWSVDEPSHNPIERDLGLILKSEAKHHAISAKLDKTFEFTGKPFIVQYEVKFQSGMDCGGAYIKLLSKTDDFNLKSFTDQTPYTIMFGPDKCGNDHKLHFIFRHKNPVTGVFEEKHADKLAAKLDDYFTDRRTHLFTLIINPDNSYHIKIDNKIMAAGSLLTHFSPPVNPPEEVEDPDDLKPDDWDNREKIPDPFVTKPEDWDETEPETILDENAVMPDGWLEEEDLYIPDPDAVKPDDWEIETDGEWEAPHIDNPKCKQAPGCGKWERPSIANPKYKGPWSAPLITNPDYKGEWKPRMISNPHFFVDNNPYNMTPIGAVGLELWSMTNNIIFDNFIIADNFTVVEKLTAVTWEVKNIQEIREFSSLGWWSAIRSSTEAHPWLWVVYSIFLAVPIILLMLCLCPKSGPPLPKGIGAQKKFDYPMPDVRDVIMEEEEAALKEENEVGRVSKTAGGGGGWGASEIGTAAIGKNPSEEEDMTTDENQK